MKNIVFRDIDIIHVQDGAAMSIHNAGTSTVSNILFDNIRVEDANQKLIDLAIFRSRYSEDGTEDEREWRKLYLNGAWDGVLMIPPGQSEFHAKFRGHIINIVFRNIQVVDGPFPYSLFYGFDTNHLVENVRIENLTLRGKKISSLQKAKIYLENTKSVIVQ
ncbi:MAG: hypothetical protein H7Y00_02530 [Fimbriimonadaceae bacterium]|nr:hypothetical protein [Chitinophagales bacterium]